MFVISLFFVPQSWSWKGPWSDAQCHQSIWAWRSSDPTVWPGKTNTEKAGLLHCESNTIMSRADHSWRMFWLGADDNRLLTSATYHAVGLCQSFTALFSDTSLCIWSNRTSKQNDQQSRHFTTLHWKLFGAQKVVEICGCAAALICFVLNVSWITLKCVLVA